jgi:signal transduction histidine kinase
VATGIDARLMPRAPVVAGATVALVGAAIALAAVGLVILDRQSPPAYTLAGLNVGWSLAVRTAVQTAGLLTMSAVAGVIVWRRPRALLSVLFLALVASLTLQAFASEYAVHGLLVAPGSLPLADLAAWSEKFLPDLGFLAGAGLILLFPDGRLSSPRWRILLAAAIVYLALDLVAGLDDPYPMRVGETAWVLVPVTLPPAMWPIGKSLAFASGAISWARPVLGSVIVVYLIRRLATASGEARLQLKWFAYAGTVLVVAFLLEQADGPPTLEWLPDQIRAGVQQFADSETAHAVASWSGLVSELAATMLLSLAIGVAMVRYRLYDIDVVINKTILYGGLAIFVTVSYSLVVGVAGSLIGAGLDPVLAFITIAVLALLLLPVRTRLQGLANTAIYGKRAKPYDVLSDFVDSIGHAEPADVLLPRMAELLMRGTGASLTEVWAIVGDRLHLAASSRATGGTQSGGVASVEPVFNDDEALGALVVIKPRGEELNAVERRLFHDLAAQAGLVLGRFRLVQELRDSRSRIVATQDAERHRIERNLHDGAQQRFANALLALGMAQADNDQRADRDDLLAQASREVQAGLNELRTLARGLEPPLLAESGLLAAITDLAERSPIPTTVVGAADRRYPKGLETAAYFVVGESLTNAVKHSSAAAVAVTLSEAGRRLCIEVRDDGVGGVDPSRGSGLVGLQDRVAAVGGRLTVKSPKGGGTVITAELPWR